MISLPLPRSAAVASETEPIRAEIFGVERFEQHARSLAEAQLAATGQRRGYPLLVRLEQNSRVLHASYRALTVAVRRDEAISPAAEWLIDNFFLVDDQIRIIRDALPADYYRELPKILSGHLADHPRVYGLIWAFVAHTDSRFDPDLLARFVRAYQDITPLTMGELWAVPITLRLALVENLRRIAVQVVRSREARAEANALADRLLVAAGGDPDDDLEALEAYAAKPLDSPFAVALVQRLRESDPAVMPALGWLEDRLAEDGTTSEEIVRREHMSQLAAHATIVNVFTSLRHIGSYDWREFFESVSLVERVLRRDPTRIYAQMDFTTRDTYRHAVEELARGSKRSELEVAQEVLQKATLQSDAGDGAEPRRHLGYWLIRGGRRELEKELGYRAPVSAWLRRGFLAAATAGYLGTITVVSALLVTLLVVYLAQFGLGTAVLAALAVLSLLPASDLAIALVQRDVIELLEPRRLPKMDFRSGVPEFCSTLVVVPTLLTDVEAVRQQVERLERHYLATARGHIAHALLSDWKDADAEELPGDDPLLAAAARGVTELNQRYGPRPDGGPRFLLLHRRRIWNPVEGVWMGWERKRGKIDELNRLLRGDRDTSYILRADGLTDVPPNVRYVLTLDSDTRLPLEAGEKLVGAMAHPLNRPWLDLDKQRVTRGYAILQPRVTPILPPADEMTLYHRIYSGPTGLDPYVSAVSDVYQDLFNEASYVGKGIYDVDAFAAALEDRVPENTLLSHDLFEGAFARTGLITDVEVFDEFPTHYETSARRVHRWARGDWQLLPWIVGRSPGVDGRTPPHSLSLISRWKMLDNLRRTFSPPSTFLLLVAGWALLPVSPLLWTGFVVTTLAMPAAVPVLTGLIPQRRGIAKRSHIRAIAADAVTAAAQVGLSVVFVANRAVLMVDAITRTLYRLFVSRRRLLEWVTAAQAERGVYRSLGEVYRKMWSPVALGLAVLVLLLLIRPRAALEAFPVVALWLASPAFALWLSRPLGDRGLEELDDESEAALRRLARRTWGFFEVLVNEDNGWLPPDNLQADPETVVAHRTSPTNVGMYLISTVAARDLGWIGTEEMARRFERTCAALDGLERHAGHLFNWYDTRTLLPLEPRYVSTVDSGNLAGHLLTAAQACRELARKPVLRAALRGIGDAFVLAREAARVTSEALRSATISRHDLDESLQTMAEALAEEPATSAAWAALLGRMESAAATLCDVAEVLAEENGEEAFELMTWSGRVADAIASHRRDLRAVAPWGEILAGDVPTWLSADPGRRERWERVLEALGPVPAPASVSPVARAVEIDLDALAGVLEGSGDFEVEAARRWVESLRAAVRKGRESAAELVERLQGLAARADGWVEETDFRILYDDERELFAIGYRPLEGRLDSGYYDLLATEARLASLVAIAKGDVPVEHWFRLGRPVTPVGKDAALISWSGSMFEYMMPYLIMKAPAGTLLDRTQRLVVRRQIQYGSERGVPWGVSESAYNARDLAFTYQYSHFGIPGLGLTRGLSDDLVVAPYATVLAAMIEPRAAVRNLERLAALGARGHYGFFEALDFTPIRLPKDQKVEVVQAYMAHHQGMTIAAIDNVVNDGVLRERFHRVPMIGAAELVLQERVPRDMAVARPRPEEVKAVRHVREIVPPAVRRFSKPHTRVPRTHILSNGRYSVLLTNSGSGYSRHLERAVTRWREDTTRDGWGSYLYLRDVASGEVWSAGYQPTAVDSEHYEVLYSEDRAEIHRLDGAIWTSLEVIVSPEDDGELRRLTIKNLGARPREIEVTSYAELVLVPPAAADAHPAFQNLFVRTEFVPALDALIATRRPREGDDPEIWATHVVAVGGGETVGGLQCETDRARFLDRGRGVRRPSVIFEGRPLSNTTGSVLDPIFSLRRTVRLQSGESARLTFSTLVADSRDEALALADKYREAATFEREAALAWTQAQVQLQHLGIDADEAHLFQRLASRILYLDPGLRPSSVSLSGNEAGQGALWGYGISGDRPVVLVRIDHIRDREIVRHLIRAHEYWGMKGLAVDLVIVNEHPHSYAEELQDWLERSVRVSQSSARHEIHAGHGEIFILRADQIPEEDQLILRTVARAVLLSHHGSLAEQLEAALREEPGTTLPGKPPARLPTVGLPPPRPRLSFFNGLGGFAEGGREYVTILGEGQWTPAPWINVISNPRFGFQVSESGAGFTWAVNSRENRLTPWSNDPVTDPIGETLYIRDEDSGAIWTPTPLPVRQPSPYQIHHGQGYSRFELQCHEIASRLTQFVPVDDPVKISRLTLRNLSERTRRLSVTAYVEWVLGVFREKSAPFVVTTIDEETRALFAWNRWNPVYAERVAFADLSGQQDEWTADRTEFLGRNGTLRHPAAMVTLKPLSGRTGTGWDPCGALRQYVTLRPGDSVEVVFLLGQGDDLEGSRRLVARYRTADLDAALGEVETWWEDVLGALQVRTPDYSMSIMLNRWLLYQALSCRYWARSAFYQSGGAYGFRDQLQDVTALVVSRREIVREHILRAAAHQFVEGDVLHWWHPPTGKGVRTTISDDRSWLPLTLIHYLAVTGDEDVLDEEVPFLKGEALAEGEHEKYLVPELSEETGTLYEHCARALDVSLGLGPHDLPLIGTGDWNDGMNRVGEQGRGESVWLAWFLLLNLRGFVEIAERRGDSARVDRWRAFAERVTMALEEHGWDGDWYRRAYFDDGTPIGSASNEECRIDSIAQSWAVLSGAAPPDRAAHAMKAVEQYLVRRGDGLVLLFTPPFDRTPLDPGYIKGYVPGIRENGGQYTHAAIWSVIAFAELGDGDKAAELFSILNPINHASTRAGIYRYKVEPYVAVADVYAEPPHVGRGGWTWYTGSAGWMYRAGVEWILGFRLRGETLLLDPCIPRDWPGFEISFRYHSARYEVDVQNPEGVMRGVRWVELDGEEVPDQGWPAERIPAEVATAFGGGADGGTRHGHPAIDPIEGDGVPQRDEGPESLGPGQEEDLDVPPSHSPRGARIPLVNDGRTHTVRVTLG